MTEMCEHIRKLPATQWVLVALAMLTVTPTIITAPGWVAAGIWGMYVFIKTICIFWPVAIVVGVAGVIWYALDPHS